MPRTKQLQLIALFGILLLILGTGMFIYSLNLIEQHQQTLTSTEVTLDQLWNFESSLNWWTNVLITLILPLTSAFMFIGGITLSAQTILQTVNNKKIAKKHKIKKKKPLEEVRV